jgi:hypothetical protein
MKIKATMLMRLVAAAMCGWLAAAAHAAGPGDWQQPAAALAEQIAGMLGPGPAQLTVRNLSSIPAEQVPAIQRLLQEDLKAHGITSAGEQSANSIRVTLSETAQQRLWVAEVMEGDQTQVAMVELGPADAKPAFLQDGIELHKEVFLAHDTLSAGPGMGGPVLAVLEEGTRLLVLSTDEATVFDSMGNGTWNREADLSLDLKRALPRDARGVLIPAGDGDDGFTAIAGGNRCDATFTLPADPGAHYRDAWSMSCRQSDDPWPLARNGSAASATALKGFYNASRNYFTGVVAPSLGVDLPPFYSAVAVPRPGSDTGLLVAGIDGKMQLVENGALHTVTGTRDWGSDFAVLSSGCGSGTQAIVSGSGEAASDSLRAYALPAFEAIPASEPLEFSGTIMELSTAPNGKSVLAIVRSANGYEVDRVTALCN